MHGNSYRRLKRHIFTSLAGIIGEPYKSYEVDDLPVQQAASVVVRCLVYGFALLLQISATYVHEITIPTWQREGIIACKDLD
jgi:hypothetical protein